MKNFFICIVFWFSVNSFVFAADSVGNRKDQTVRIGQKSGLHLMYLISSPFVLEFPGENLTFGFVYGSGDLKSTTTSGSSTVKDIWTFTTTELTGRYYLGNSFNIPFGVAIYNIHKDDNDEITDSDEITDTPANNIIEEPEDPKCPAKNIDINMLDCTRKNTLKIHPDKNPGCTDLANEKFNKFNNVKCKGNFRSSGGKRKTSKKRNRKKSKRTKRKQRKGSRKRRRKQSRKNN